MKLTLGGMSLSCDTSRAEQPYLNRYCIGAPPAELRKARLDADRAINALAGNRRADMVIISLSDSGIAIAASDTLCSK